MLGQNDANLRPNLPAFERFDTCECRPGLETLDRQANLGDLGVKRHVTWGISVQISFYGKAWHNSKMAIKSEGILSIYERLAELMVAVTICVNDYTNYIQ
jgi:hypothetical protein